ncbi:DUF6907 domain-containing protein [Streptomyces mesophilus]|uniref:DUF6907 domain-containing protein n=1 Tax=Streptomyces mesophilus TaxID=1775132 RepID=UPI003330DB2E
MTVKTVQCPAWCVIAHEDDWPQPEDVFHRSNDLMLQPPKGSMPDRQTPLPALRAELILPQVPEDNDPACILLDHHDVYGPYAQLDVEHADQMIRDLKTFTARLQGMRNQLAALKEALR